MRKARAVLLAAIVTAGAAAAQEFPVKPVRLVVPNPAGGTVDIVARTLAQSMSTRLGQNVIVEIRPGGNTIIGSEVVARAPADGHTILMIGMPFAMNPLVRQLPYDTLKDFAPVARLASFPFVIAVHPSVPAKSLKELVVLAKTRPGELNYAAFVTGQLLGETFKSLAGIEMVLVPYQGGVQATISVVGGHAGVLVGPLSDATPHIASGRLRALAVSSRERSDTFKEVPTVAESGYPGFEWINWIGAAVPAATPKPVVARLSAEMLRALQTPEATAGFARLSVSPAPMTPEQFDGFIRAEMHRYDTVITQAKLKVE
jgi:tripartite-type tricarboxylate transporter receptor subunit TctC